RDRRPDETDTRWIRCITEHGHKANGLRTPREFLEFVELVLRREGRRRERIRVGSRRRRRTPGHNAQTEVVAVRDSRRGADDHEEFGTLELLDLGEQG